MAQDRPGEDRAKNLVAMVHAKLGESSSLGAALILGLENDRLYLVTANHIVRGDRDVANQVTLELCFLPGESLDAEVLPFHDRDLDVALLVVKRADSKGIRRAAVVDGRLGTSAALRRGVSVFSTGWARGVKWWTNVAPDPVSQVTSLHFDFESPLGEGGQSGGGVFDENWSLVGMVVSGSPVDTKAIRIEQVLSFALQHRIPISLTNAPENLTRRASDPTREGDQGDFKYSARLSFKAIEDVVIEARVYSLTRPGFFTFSKPVPLVQGKPIDNDDFEAFISTDRENYAPLPTYFSLPSAQPDVFWLKLRNGESEVGPFEKRGLLTTAEQRAFRSSKGGLVDCSPTGCKFLRSSWCGWRASRLTLGRTSGLAEAVFDLHSCLGSEERIVEVCLASLEDMFAPKPGEDVFVGIEWSDGVRVEQRIDVKVRLGRPGNPEGTWVELSPRPGQREVPYVAASLGPRSVELYLGLGGCGSARGGQRRWGSFLYDLDGRGMIEVARESPEAYFTVRGAPGPVLSLGFETHLGKRLGPFTYQFDLIELFKAASSIRPIPRLECSARKGQDSGELRWRCHAPAPGAIVDWFKVRGVRWGPRPHQLDRAGAVSLAAEAFFVFGPAPALVDFEIPESWTELFYRLELEDGTLTDVYRLSLGN